MRMAFRVGLAERLELAGQPHYMVFVNKANVSQAQLDAAAAQVLGNETSQLLRASIVSRDFWVDFLKTRYGARFDETSRPFFSGSKRSMLTSKA
ncbi:hypothetical protein KC131_17280 [Pseudomonas sp. JQ170]|nr:hypothetical protein [Pseudomonas sp. JQ170]